MMMMAATTFAQSVTDYHSHIITPEYRAALAEHGMLMDEGFPLPTWSAEEHLQLMDESSIAKSILTHPAPHPYFGDQEECYRLCRQFNEQAADVCRQHPDRFGFCAVLPLPDVQAAIREAKYALDTLGAAGVKLATNVYGQYLGDEALDPLMEYLSDCHALVILHPHKPSPVNNALMQQTPLAMQGYLSETTNAVCNMISRNVLARYPGMRVVVPHCGAYLPIAIPRMRALYPVMRQNGMVGDIDFDQNIASLWFDLAGSPTEGTIDALLTLTSRDHLLYGSDYPYVASVAVKNILSDLRERNLVGTPKTENGTIWPKGEPNTGYAQYFIGNSYLAPMEGGLVNVTFEPRCRNNWHIHHKQVQVLICVAGRGWYQEWGKEPVELKPGMVIEIPEGVKHWHGAAKDSWFQHLTYHKDVQEGASNEWLEPVTDDIYNKLK